MRVNVYSEELTGVVSLVTKGEFHGIRFLLASPAELHDTPEDDDRSAVTFWGLSKVFPSLEKALALRHVPKQLAGRTRELELTGKLQFDKALDRWLVKCDTGPDWELHCGDCLDVQVGGAWVSTRVEHNGAAYCFVTPGLSMCIGLPARQASDVGRAQCA